MLLISVPAIAAGILAKRLPETKDALLPETLEDAMMLDFRFAHKITHFTVGQSCMQFCLNAKICIPVGILKKS